MSGPGNDRLAHALRAWTAWVRRHAALVVLAFVLLTAGAGTLAITRLKVDTDTSAMLSADLPWRQAELALAQAFPDNGARIVAVIQAAQPDVADAAVNRLLTAARAQPQWFARVESPFSGPFFERQGLLYLDLPALEKLASDLQAAQPFLGRLSSDPSLAGLFGLLEQALAEPTGGLPMDLAQVLQPLTATLDAVADGRDATLSWSQLMGSSALAASGPRFVLLQPRDLAQERAAVQGLRGLIGELGLDRTPGLRVRLTGEGPLWIDELDAAADGALRSGIAALLLGAGFLYLGLRSARLVLSCLACLVVGLILTAGFATLSVGRLNMISVAFGTLYIGVAIDYGVQLCMRYRELLGAGQAHGEALEQTGGGFGAALVLCALTTVAGFYAFAPTDYRGVAELGVIAGSGILIGLLTSLSLLPALIELAPPGASERTRVAVPAALVHLAQIPARYPGPVRLVALLLALGALALLPRLRFDYNPMHLKPLHAESLQAYQDLVSGATSPLNASVLVRDAVEAERVAQSLESLDSVAHAITLERLVPRDQQAKLDLLADLNFSLALPAHLQLATLDAGRDRAAMRAAAQRAQHYRGEAGATAAARALARALHRWESLDDTRLLRLRDALLGPLPGLITRLGTALAASAFDAADLPTNLQAQWRAADGRRRVEVMPRENLDEDRALLHFVDQVWAVAPAASGPPMSYVGGARSVIAAFLQAFALAAVLIVVFLFLLLRSLGDTLRALAPLALGSLLLGACMVLTGARMNFANVIALPLLLGIGVDIGVLILWRARQGGAAASNPVLSGTGAGVLVSVLATLGSFASLMLSADRGMSTIGELLTWGLLIDLACTFLILPALLPQGARHPSA